jgi:hypothetical protein
VESSHFSTRFKAGDLVSFNVSSTPKLGYCIVLEVKNWGLIREEEIFVRFIDDMSKGWFRSSQFNLVSRGNEDDKQACF